MLQSRRVAIGNADEQVEVFGGGGNGDADTVEMEAAKNADREADLHGENRVKGNERQERWTDGCFGTGRACETGRLDWGEDPHGVYAVLWQSKVPPRVVLEFV